MKPDLLIHQEEVTADDRKLECPADEGTQSGAGHTHSRGAQLSEDEYPVEENIYKEGADGADQRDMHLPNVAQHQGGGHGQTVEQVAGEGPSEVPDTFCNDGLIRGHQAQNLCRE